MIRRTWLVVAVLAATPAYADTASEATAHAEAGKKAFAAGKYGEAITEFRAANALQADPKLLYAIAQAQRMSGDCRAAIASYEEFIQSKADPKLVEYSQANITRCKEQLAKEPAPDPTPDPKPDPTPDPKPDPQPDHPAAPTTVGSTEPQPQPQPPPQRDTGPSWTSDWIGHGLVGGGLAMGVIGTILWTGGRSDAAAANDATDYASFIAKRDAADGALTKQRIGIALGVAGVAALGYGVYHYKTSSKKEVRITAGPSAGGGTVTARWSF